VISELLTIMEVLRVVVGKGIVVVGSGVGVAVVVVGSGFVVGQAGLAVIGKTDWQSAAARTNVRYTMRDDLDRSVIQK
jgi:hypothetical protein